MHAADEFKSESSTAFLEQPEGQQDGYISVAVGMTLVVASRSHPNIAQCIDGWYTTDQASRRNDFIRGVMRDHGEFHPMGVILAVIEKQCGSFKRD